jgi:septal ring factor EnvC (AmiA/AmiB activator)
MTVYDIPRYMLHKKRYRQSDMRLINKYEVNDVTVNTKDMNYMMMAKELGQLRDKIAEQNKLLAEKGNQIDELVDMLKKTVQEITDKFYQIEAKDKQINELVDMLIRFHRGMYSREFDIDEEEVIELITKHREED